MKKIPYSDDELKVFSEPGNSTEEVKQKGKSILTKMDTAYRKRSSEVSQLLSDMPNDGWNFLLCGIVQQGGVNFLIRLDDTIAVVDGKLAEFIKVERVAIHIQQFSLRIAEFNAALEVLVQFFVETF